MTAVLEATGIFNANDYANAIDEITEAAEKTIPTEIVRIKVSEWAESRRVITEGFCKGSFSYDVTPYLREIADCLSESEDVREVAVMKGARIGYNTGVLEPFLGYFIEHGQGRFGFASADAESAAMQIETKIDELIMSAGLGHLIGIKENEKRKDQKKSGDKTLRKRTAGGWIHAGGPNDALFKRQLGFNYFAGDEVDADAWFMKSQDGDRIDVFRGRFKEFETTYKAVWGSSPKFTHNSNIRKAYKEGDQRKYFVPCKHCGHMQFLRWGEKDKPGGIKFEHDEEYRLIDGSVYYECEKCGGHWRNEDKEFFLRDKAAGGMKTKKGKRVYAEWRPTAVSRRPGMRSYHIPQLLAPVGSVSWDSIVSDFLNIKHAGSPAARLQVWTNLCLGEPFEERGGRPKVETLLAREKTYKAGSLPEEAKPLFVTVGADVQGGENSRIECEVVAWGRNFESWSIDYHVIPGNTSDLDDPCWSALRGIITKKYAGMQPVLSGVDAGYNSQTVYEFCDTFESGVHPVMGQDYLNKNRQYIKAVECVGHKHYRIDINDNLFKQEIYSFIAKGQFESGSVPRGFCHFPEDYPRQHFIQLTNEQRVAQRDSNGVTKLKWQQTGKNEQLDCRKYALSMVYAYRESIEIDLQNGGQLEEDEKLSWSDFWNYCEAHPI